MGRMSSVEGVLAYLASHPPSPERAARIREAGDIGDSALTDGEWAALKKICGAPAPD